MELTLAVVDLVDKDYKLYSHPSRVLGEQVGVPRDDTLHTPSMPLRMNYIDILERMVPNTVLHHKSTQSMEDSMTGVCIHSRNYPWHHSQGLRCRLWECSISGPNRVHNRYRD